MKTAHKLALLAAIAAVLVTAFAFAGTNTPAVDYGPRWTKGTLAVSGVSTLAALDAGTQSKVGGEQIGALIAQDGGLATHTCQFGYGAGSGGVLAVTFTTAFTSVPQCQCTHVGTTNLNGCVLTTASQPTTTAASFSVTSGGTDIIDWFCCGDL